MSTRPALRVPARAAPVAAWVLAAGVVLAQIVYSMTDPADRIVTTVLSVALFCAASVLDAAARFGARAAGLLVLVAGGGGLLAEAVGVHTGFPFGRYAYTGTLGAQLLGVPVVVPMAWVMMAWPALLVGRALGARLPGGGRAVVPVATWALASWDVFLDPQMVDAGHWTWAHPTPALPGVADVPLTNFAGWLLVAALITGALHVLLGGADRRRGPTPDVDLRRGPSLAVDLRRGPAPVLYLWTYGSSVWAHAAFFDRPGSSLVGGLLMGAVAVPFAVALWRAHR
ncbi:carotenoid biosynthesis protein [Saccharothrix algeriensis]|uniref:Carotenoid biosynthesis protein n=1 Tax=Saccharothrix algeriensis TaxID=173560 RepID=A0A8T8I0A5_9PSEU|nr:carotenoid biosynthesis protein [Saccharothrix algeriensis]MBM7809837.1 putative membrane protein [Saccharothrix algeriensis]QTR04108.1 carotenoid biosynthesis protein [Saccharothrix algeriensis]